METKYAAGFKVQGAGFRVKSLQFRALGLQGVGWTVCDFGWGRGYVALECFEFTSVV